MISFKFGLYGGLLQCRANETPTTVHLATPDCERASSNVSSEHYWTP